MDHIDALSHLREQVAFSGFAQRDPVIEYQDQAFRRFQQLVLSINATAARMLLNVEWKKLLPEIGASRMEEESEGLSTNEEEIEGGLAGDSGSIALPSGSSALSDESFRVRAPTGPSAAVRRSEAKTGRNDPCPCGSGKKFKKCHGTS
jgi:preprotein translocase subunit SecA